MAVNGLAERPEDFAKEDVQPDEMNYFELREYVERLRASGARVSNYLVDLHLKLAFPLICLVVVLIGGALATRLRMQSAALGFGLSMAISFFYYGAHARRPGARAQRRAAALRRRVDGRLRSSAAIGLYMMVQAQRR